MSVATVCEDRIDQAIVLEYITHNRMFHRGWWGDLCSESWCRTRAFRSNGYLVGRQAVVDRYHRMFHCVHDAGLCVRCGYGSMRFKPTSAFQPLLSAKEESRWRGMDECQTIKLSAQIAHVYMSLMAFVILERARAETGRTWYDLKREMTFHPQTIPDLLSTLNLVGA